MATFSPVWLRTRAGLATRLTLFALGTRYMLRLGATFAAGSSRPQPQEAAASAGVAAG